MKLATNALSTAHDIVIAVDAYRQEHPKLSYDKAMRHLGINSNVYYEARRALGLGGVVVSKENIRPGEGVTKKRIKRMVWDPVNLRGEWV